jgi:hypothetical protein
VPGAKAQPSPSGKRAERTAASGQGHRRSAPPPRGLHESTREACATSPKRSRVEMTQPPTSSTPHLRLCFATRRRYPCTVRPSHRRNSHRLLLLLAVPSRPRSSCLCLLYSIPHLCSGFKSSYSSTVCLLPRLNCGHCPAVDLPPSSFPRSLLAIFVTRM